MTDANDEQLMAAYVAGDPAAFEALFRRYVDVITGFVRRRIGNPDDVREVVQEAFLRVHRSRHSFDATRTLRPWLLTVAANISRDHVRRSAQRMVPLGELPAPPARDELEVREKLERVLQVMTQLPRAQRTVLELQCFEDLSHCEIARRVGITRDAVKQRAFRGRAALRHAFA